MIIPEPPARHHCRPPELKPEAEWRTIAPPLGFMRPEDRATAKPVPIPTSYAPGTVWVCGCGRGWIKRQGAHYGRNPNFGHTEGRWSPVRWWHFHIHHRIDTEARDRAYVRDQAVIDSFVLPEPPQPYCGPGTYWVSPPNAKVVYGPLEPPPSLGGPS